jgi:hypothetical protein
VAHSEFLLSSVQFWREWDSKVSGALDKESVDGLIDNIISLCNISWLDSIEVHNLGASLSHEMGMPAVDSLILAGFVTNGSETSYTTLMLTWKIT